MNNLMQNNVKTMSSLEVSSLTGKSHSNVLRDIRNMLSQLDKSILNYQQYQVVTDIQTNRTSEIKLDKDLTITLITGYDVNTRHRINKRWQELEQQVSASNPVMPALPNFTDPYESALAWAEQYKAKEVAQAQVVELQPKAAALDTLSHAKGSLGVRETAKAVGIPEREFVKRCLDKSKPMSSRFLYRDDKGRLNAHAHRIKQGFMTQKIGSYEDKDGYDFTTVQVKFTAAGVAHIAKLMQNKPSGQLRVV